MRIVDHLMNVRPRSLGATVASQFCDAEINYRQQAIPDKAHALFANRRSQLGRDRSAPICRPSPLAISANPLVGSQRDDGFSVRLR